MPFKLLIYLIMYFLFNADNLWEQHPHVWESFSWTHQYTGRSQIIHKSHKVSAMRYNNHYINIMSRTKCLVTNVSWCYNIDWVKMATRTTTKSVINIIWKDRKWSGHNQNTPIKYIHYNLIITSTNYAPEVHSTLKTRTKQHK